jgi:hypothetical protein
MLIFKRWQHLIFPFFKYEILTFSVYCALKKKKGVKLKQPTIKANIETNSIALKKKKTITKSDSKGKPDTAILMDEQNHDISFSKI